MELKLILGFNQISTTRVEMWWASIKGLLINYNIPACMNLSHLKEKPKLYIYFKNFSRIFLLFIYLL